MKLDMPDALVIAGALGVVVGLALVHPALGLVALGVILAAAGLIFSGGPPPTNQGGA